MLILFCDVVEPSTGELYAATRARPPSAPKPISSPPASATPSMSAPKPSSSCSTTCASTTAYNGAASSIDDIELPTNTGKRSMKAATLATVPRVQGRLLPGRAGRQRSRHPRRDADDHARNGPALRQAPPRGGRRQHELGLTFGTLVNTADRMQIYKYVVHQVAHAYGKTATFMPKPIKGDNGSGMHTHISIWKGQAAVRRQRLCRSPRCACISSAASSSTPRR
jgi:glutamine synthetase